MNTSNLKKITQTVKENARIDDKTGIFLFSSTESINFYSPFSRVNVLNSISPACGQILVPVDEKG